MLSPGDVFAGYTVLSPIGAGGMGEVYLVEHPRLPRKDALKILGAELSDNDDYRARFIREADLAGRLWHPNIVRVNDRGDFQGQLWIAMDYIAGSDAAQLLRRYPTGLPINDVTAIITAVGSALDYAHSKGLLHRDVKPANILLTNPDEGEERRILLGDFGIARTQDEVSGLTATGMTVGTVAYTAPEQLMGDEIDGRADQYALAASAYHLLTGTQLFPNTNPAATISRHLNAPPPSVSALRPEAGALDAVLSRALSKNPADRYPRCADFAQALTKAASTAMTQPGLAGPTMQAPRPAAQPEPVSPPIASTPIAAGPAHRTRPAWLIPAAVGAMVSAIGVAAALKLIPNTEHTTPAQSVQTVTALPLPASPPAAAPRPTTPKAEQPDESRGVVLPAANGRVYVETVSGKTACNISADSVGCDVTFTVPTPKWNGMNSNAVSVNPDGKVDWGVWNFGDPPGVTTLQYDTAYHALGWTIAPTREGTSFTYDQTGHGMTVSVTGVDAY